jgi:hypothetical protein
MPSRQVVVITGALTGIGRAAAAAFARDGAAVVVSGRHADKGSELTAELRSLGAAAEFVPTDVRREVDVSNLIDTADARFGRIDIAVNSAGIEGAGIPVTEVTPQNYATIFDTNVLGTFLRRVAVLGKQARRRGFDQVGGAGRSPIWSSRQCHRPRADPDRHAGPHHRVRRAEDRLPYERAAGTGRNAGGGRRSDPVRRVGAGNLHHRTDHPCQRRQDCILIVAMRVTRPARHHEITSATAVSSADTPA